MSLPCRHTGRLFPLLLVWSVWVSPSAVWVTASRAVADNPRPELSSPQLSSAVAKELWQKGAEQILTGDFVAAQDTLQQVEALEPGHREVAEAADWVKAANTLKESRDRLRVRNYEHFIAEAKKAVEAARSEQQAAATQPASEGEEAPKDYAWSKGEALLYAQRALVNAREEDKESLRSEPWLKETVEHTLIEIEKYKSDGKWRDALALYDILQELYPHNAAYKDGFDFCRRRAHLDFFYGPKGEWRSALRDVNPDSISEIVSRIEDDYVESVDFKKLCISGLDNVILLAEAKSLTETFPQLGDADLVNSFVNQIKGLIKRRIDPATKFGGRAVSTIFRQVLRANSDGLRLPENVVVDEFISGMLEPLDEFTAVIWPAEVDEFNKHTRGSFVGVGIQITQPEGSHVRVESPLEDSPAYWAGVKPGDLITEVDGKSTLDLSITQAVQAITGEPGTQVTLTVLDPMTNESRKITLTRSRIEIRTVRGYHRDDSKPTGWDFFVDPDSKIGYVAVTGFMDKTVRDFEDAMTQLDNEGCRGLILDLRFNPGGLLTSAVQMCELFLHENDPIVQTKGRSRSQNTEILSRFGEGSKHQPLMILVNEYSASASEIVAGALAGLREACILGERTFGKGSVQNLIPIEDNQAYLKLTTAYYYIPDKDLPEKWYLLHRKENADFWGVEPHVSVPVIPQELVKILRLRREREMLKGKDQAEIPQAVLERQATTQPNPHVQEDEDPNTDPQLAVALDMMRMKLLSRQPWTLSPRHPQALTQAAARNKKDAAMGVLQSRSVRP